MAGRFNLNQILTDVSKREAEGEPSSVRLSPDQIVKLSVYDLVPSDDNFYSIGGIEELKSNIELAGKVLQNLVVVPLGDGKYKVISGHRRRLASIALVEEGNPQYEHVPCAIEETEQDAEARAIREEILLIAANSQREKTAWDKLEEVRRMRILLERVRQQGGLCGGMRGMLADALHTSSTQVGRIDAILNNLCPEFMEELKCDRINISTAYELSGLSLEEQREKYAAYQSGGEISIKAVRAAKPKRGSNQERVQVEPTELSVPANIPESPETASLEPQPVTRALPERDVLPVDISRQETSRRVETAPPPKETRCESGGVCPYCGQGFDAERTVNYSTRGTQDTGPVACPHCGGRIRIACLVEYCCSGTGD